MGTMAIRPNVFKKKRALAQRLAAENGGILPSPQQLIDGGYEDLYRYMKRHPDAFEDLSTEKLVDTDEVGTFNVSIRRRYIAEAIDIAKKKRQKKIPSADWYELQGHRKLASYYRMYPHVFKNLSVQNGTAKKVTKKKRF